MAVNADSKLRDILASPEACEIIDRYSPGFQDRGAEMGPCMGMKFSLLIKFPQCGFTKEQIQSLTDELNALDK